MHRLGMPVSDDTILRQLKRGTPASIQKDIIRVVGIDDWSWRHSSRYGTIMVDLERHSVVDVLEDRVVWHLTVRMRPFRQVMALNLRFFGAIFGT